LIRNLLRIMMGLLTGHCHVRWHLFNLGLVGSPGCGRCIQAFEMVLHVLCDCEALATLRFRHLGQHFMKRDDFDDISVSSVLHFVQGAVHCWVHDRRAAQKILNGQSAWVTAMPTHMFSILFYVRVLLMFTWNRTNMNYYMKMILKVLLYFMLHLSRFVHVSCCICVVIVQFYSNFVYIDCCWRC
jgi:hypothetical protein